MKLRDFIPPAFARFVARSFASDWLKARDLDGPIGTAGRRASLTQPFAQSAWVHAAVNLITGEIAGREVQFFSGESEHVDPAFAAWWAAPAWGPPTVLDTERRRLPIEDVLRDLAAWWKLEGEFFLLFDDSWIVGRSGRNVAAFTPFIIARPDRVRLIIEGGEIAGYEYIDAGGRRSVFVPSQVIHRKAFNPYDDFRGVGDLRAALIPAEAVFFTGTYVRELMRNNGDQGFIVASKNGPLDDPQREQVIADLRAKRAALARGEARDLFFNDAITVERPSEQAAGAELLAGKSLTQQEIFIAFGVPPSMAESKQSYSLGKDSDRYQLITATCQPLGCTIASAFAETGKRQLGRDITAELDWDDHPVMIEVRNSRIEALGKLCDRGMPVKNASEFLDLGMKPFPGWDRGYLPFSVQPVDSPEPAPAIDPAFAEAPEDTPADPEVQRMRALILAKMRCTKVAPASAPVARDDFAIFACSHPGVTARTSGAGLSVEQRGRWETYMSQRRATLKSFESAFKRVLTQARVETLRKIETFAAKHLSAQKSAATDLLFDLARFALEFRGVMSRAHDNALQTAGQQLFDEVNRDDPFKYPPDAAVRFVRERMNLLSGVPDDVHARIKRTLEAGLEAGETTEQLADRVRAEFNGIDAGRARVIASTETAAAYGSARDEAMKQAGVQWKAWLTSGNANVRSAHADAGLTYSYDTPIPSDEPFVVGGERLMHPGDQSGSAWNVINCHCVSIAVANGPDDSAS